VLKICCFLWKRDKRGFRLPAICDYGPEHVYRLKRGFERHLHVPHEFICITDFPELPGVRTLPLWDKCRGLGGCFNWLYVFSEDMRGLIGERFACVDLACVVTGDVTPILTRTENFLIHRYQPAIKVKNPKDQRYNGGFFLMNAGEKRSVWDEFNPKASPELIKNHPDLVGSDQAWIRFVLGTDETTLGPEHGLYEARNIGANLPDNAKMVFFSGPRDPSRTNHNWIKEHWI
jgi:hypothetical protein